MDQVNEALKLIALALEIAKPYVNPELVDECPFMSIVRNLEEAIAKLANCST